MRQSEFILKEAEKKAGFIIKKIIQHETESDFDKANKSQGKAEWKKVLKRENTKRNSNRVVAKA